METAINEEILDVLIEESMSIQPFARPAGSMVRQIEEYGYYEEHGIRFTQDDYRVGQLYSGLAVLSRDMHHYLSQHPRDDAILFTQAVKQVHSLERQNYGLGAFPDYIGLQGVEALPKDLALAATLGKLSFTPLGSKEIVHEWTFKPGKKVFVQLLQRAGPPFKRIVCTPDGPLALLNQELQKPAIRTIAKAILATCFTVVEFWVPLAVVTAAVLVDLGLRKYCEQGLAPQLAEQAGNDSSHL